MGAKSLLGAGMTALMAVTMLGEIPAGAANDNGASAWAGRRVLQTPGSTDGTVHVLSNRGKMVTVVRELGAGSDVWRIRESRDGGLGFSSPIVVPREVSRFRYDERQGTTYAAYEHDGRLWAAEADEVRAAALTLPTNLAAAGSEAPKVAAGESHPDHALITQGGTWHQHFGPVAGADPETTPQGTDGPASRWVSYPDPDVDGVPGNAGEDYAFANSQLLTFWNAPNGDLRVAWRAAPDTAAAFSGPQTIAADERYVDLVETDQGARLVTQSTDGAVNIYSYSGWNTATFGDRRVLADAAVGTPQVVVDALGTLTVGWHAPTVQGGGLVLWQEGSAGSGLLRQPTRVPGTRDSDARVVTSPRGNLAVAFQRRGAKPAPIRVKHLPAGTITWTDGIRLLSPKPLATTGEFAIGSPHRNGDLRVVVNDKVGAYGFRFDAPAPYTKVTRPRRTLRTKQSYRVGWNTRWATVDWSQARARLDKGGGRYGAWEGVHAQGSQSERVITRPRGQTWCYQARVNTIDGGFTPWSEQRCVTVRRR